MGDDDAADDDDDVVVVVVGDVYGDVDDVGGDGCYDVDGYAVYAHDTYYDGGYDDGDGEYCDGDGDDDVVDGYGDGSDDE